MIWQSALGLLVLPGLAWLISEARWTVRPRTVVIGLVSQLALALALLKLPGSRPLFLALNDAVLALQSATEAGTEFVFGYLGGGEPPFEVTNPQATYILAFQALPLVLVVSALSSLLFYWRVLPWLIRGVSWLLQRTLRVGGALGTGAAANVFVGMTESPLVIRGYLQDLAEFVVVRDRDRLVDLASLGEDTTPLRRAPVGIVVVVDNDGNQRPLESAVFDCGRAFQNMKLAATDRGLGSVPQSVDRERASELLDVPDTGSVVLALALGHPADADDTIEGRAKEVVLAELGRTELDELVHWETY